MKRSRILAALLAGVMLVSLTGCSLFATTAPSDAPSEAAPTEAHGDPISTGPVVITDSCTHTDPEGLVFDHRHVLTCTNADALVMQGAPFGVNVKQMYYVLYGGEERPIAAYEYCIFDSEEQAKTYVDACVSFWSSGEVKGNVSVLYKDTEMIDADLITYASYTMISEETCAAFLHATSAMYSYVPVE